MLKMSLPTILIMASLPAHAGSLAGHVQDLAGHPLAGARVLLVKDGNATGSGSDGSWFFGTLREGIGRSRAVPAGSASSRLIVEQGRLHLDLGGVDVSGKRFANKGVPLEPWEQALRRAPSP